MLILFLISLAMVTGLLLLFESSFVQAFARIRMIRRLDARKREYKEENRFFRWMNQALAVIFGSTLSRGSFLTFLFLGAFLIVLLGWQSFGLSTGLLLASLFVLAVLMLLGIRLSSWRKRISYQGDRLVSEILRHYRMSHGNILDALEKLIVGSPDRQQIKKMLRELLLTIRSTGSRDEMKRATDQFGYAIHTNWSRMLAQNLYVAAANGTDISCALEDLLMQLKEARGLAEERKRINGEAMRMTHFMVPLLYGSTVLMAVMYLGMTWNTFFFNQFQTREGLVFFFLIVLFFLGNVRILSAAVHQTFDY